MSILNWFKKKQEYEQEQKQEQEQKPEQAGEAGVQKHAVETKVQEETVEDLLMGIWMDRKKYPDDMEAVKPFLRGIRQNLKNLEMKRKAAELLQMKKEWGQEIDGQEIQIPAADAECNVYLTSDKMIVFICVFPPIAGGEEIQYEQIKGALAKKDVKYGTDEEKICQIVEERSYGIVYAVARGKLCSHGKDGFVTDHYPREIDEGLKEDERGNVDHKSLRRFHSIQEGGLICEITPPTEGEDGIDVTGRELKAKSGKNPQIPQGRNTVLSEDGTQLLAAMDGDITFSSNGFCVDTMLTIEESVDNSVGNLDYNGNILIKGDVKSGFKVNATGDIIVQGSVGSAHLCAGGSIEILEGMNGNDQGTLRAYGDIKITFMESVNVVCYQDIYAATIVNSDIVCGGSVYATKGKGVIVGGLIKAMKIVEARRIGNQSGCENVIKLGHELSDEDDLETMQKELSTSVDTLDKINKNISYLMSKDAIPEHRKELLEKLEVQSVLYIQRIETLEEQIAEAENAKPDFSQCKVRSHIIYPTTKISLDYAKYTVRDTTPMCSIYYKDGELQMGTY